MPWNLNTVINKVSPPFPLLFPTTFDLMPLMSFQQAQDPRLEVCQLFGSVSISLGSTKNVLKSKEHDIIYIQKKGSPRVTEVKYDSGHPKDTVTQKNLWNQVLDDLGAEFSELNIETRVPVMKIPSQLNLGMDSLLLVQSKTGNFTKSLRKRFNLIGIRNPYRIMKYELQEKGLWQKEYNHKLRGVLKTINLAGFTSQKIKSWTNFFQIPEGHRFPPEVNTLNDTLIHSKWWQDNGIPVRMLGAVNSNEIEAVVYMLKRRRVVITA